MILHFFSGRPISLLQRALAARSEREARIGIITAFSSLTNTILSIGTGIAAYYLSKKGISVASDDVYYIAN